MRSIPKWPGYFADEQGNIYSLKVRCWGDKPTQPRKLKPIISSGFGYHVVTLFRDGKSSQMKIAVLVLGTFVGPRPKGMWACHGSKGYLVDTLDNLCWNTPKHNALDRIRDGTMLTGEKNHNHKLNELQVRIIRKAYAWHGVNGLTTTQLAEIFGVTFPHINSILLRKTWKWLKS